MASLCEISPVGISYSGRSMAGWKMYYRSDVWMNSYMISKTLLNSCFYTHRTIC